MAEPQSADRSGRRGRSSRRWWGIGTALVVVTLVAVAVAVSIQRAGQPQSARLAAGAPAPDGAFTTTSGQTTSISALRGQPALIWFVSTSCGSCEAGTQTMAQHIDQFAQHHVKVVELQLADNLGAGGPDIATFGRQLAGAKFTHPDWLWGTASQTLTSTYDPKSYLDIYYLLDASGQITYYDSAPDSTMNSLLTHVRALGT